MILFVACVAAAGPTGSIHGRVLGVDGKGVPSVTVTARGFGDTLGHPATTDKDGSFLIEGLPPGEYELDVTILKLWKPQPGEKVTMGDLQRRAEVVPVVGGQPQRVMVKAGQRVEHDFRIARTLTVTLVVTRDGTPLADTQVRLDLLKNGIPDVLAKKPEPKHTNARGEIELPGTAEGSYGISVFVGDWEIVWGAIEAAGKEPMRVPVAVGTRRARLKIVDASGKPVLSAWPAMRADGGHRVAPKDVHGMASSTGVYEVPCLREGKYTPTASVDAVFAKGEAIDIAPGSADPEITLALPPAGSLLVRVTDRGGKPLEGRTLHIEPPSGIPSLSFDTDAKGEVRVQYLPVGKWTVEVLDPPAKRAVELKASAEAKVTLRP